MSDLDTVGLAADWTERPEADRDRYMESLSVDPEMNLLAGLVGDP